MIRLSLINIIFFFILSGSLANGEGVFLTLAGSGQVLAEPGQIYSVVIKLTNKHNQPTTIKAKPSLPEDWQSITNGSPQKLEALETRTTLYSFRVPKLTPAGQYTIVYEVSENSNAKYSDSVEILIFVGEVIELTMELVESSNHVVAGNQATARYLVHNDGNSTQTIVLEANNCLIEGSNSFSLEAGSSRVVNVSSALQKDFAKATRQNFRLSARVEGQEKVFKDVFHNFNVIPVNETKNDLYFRFPVDISLKYLLRNYKDEFHDGFQGQIYGNGYLDQEKTKQLVFLARGPNQFDLSVLGIYDQYYASYIQKEFTAFVGDKAYHLSPLTEMSRYGRGLQAEARMDRFQVGGFYQKPRFYPSLKDELAGYANYRFYKGNNIGISYLKKTYSENLDDAHLFSLNSNLQPFRNTTLDIEVSKGYIGEKSDYGLYTNFTGNWKKVNVSAMLLYAGKYYPGYYTNSLFYTAMVNWRITRKLSISANIRQDYRNAAQDTLFGAAPYNQGYYAGIGYRFSRNIDLRVYYNHKVRTDRAAIKKFNYRENIVRIYFSHSIKRFGYYLNGEIGQSENLLITSGENTSDAYRATADLYYELTDRLRISGMVSFMSNNRYTTSTTNSWIFGGSLSGRVGKNIYLFIRYQSNYEIEEYYRDRSIFTTSVDWKLHRNHTLSATANYALTQKQIDLKDYSAAFTYTYHLGVPLKRTAVAGSVNGNINNVSAKGVKGIILHLNGHTVVTDENGAFVIKNLKPGTYYLLIDRSTIGVHELPDMATPIEIEVIGGEETFINFGLTTAGKVTGKLDVKSSKSGIHSNLLDDGEKLGHLILELVNDDESIKIISTEQGTYKFPNVRPGEWTLKVYPNGISGKFKIEKDEFQLDIKPGEELDIPINLIKKERNIIFMSEVLELSENVLPKESEQE